MMNFYDYGYKLNGYDKYYDEIILWKCRTFHHQYEHIQSIIKRSPKHAYLYATYVIKGRWIEAEPFIIADTYYSLYYALHTIKRRWPEAEHHIMKDAYIAYLYARDVIKSRWLEAEPYIKEGLSWCRYYEQQFGVKL